jgi:hypothetical protein
VCIANRQLRMKFRANPARGLRGRQTNFDLSGFREVGRSLRLSRLLRRNRKLRHNCQLLGH